MQLADCRQNKNKPGARRATTSSGDKVTHAVTRVTATVFEGGYTMPRDPTLKLCSAELAEITPQIELKVMH